MPKQTSYREELIEDWKAFKKSGGGVNAGIAIFLGWLEGQEKNRPWIPRKDEKYFYVTASGTFETHFWNNDYYHRDIQSFQGCSRTKEEAGAKAEKIRNLLKTI